MTTLVLLALAGESLVLFDFETDAELRKWIGTEEVVDLEIVEEHASSGRRALRVVVEKKHPWPGVHTGRIVHDWRGFDVLRADIYNHQERPIQFCVRIDDATSRERDYSTRYSKKLTLTPGMNPVEIRLPGLLTNDGGREVRLDAIEQLDFFATHAPAGVTFYIDNVRLEKAGRPAVSRRRGPPPLAPGAAVVTLTTGRRFICKVLEADEKKVRVRTAFASLELKRSQIKSIEGGGGGAPVARARERVDFFASIPADGGEARGIQKRNLKFAGGFNREGRASGTAVRGLRCGDKFLLALDAGGQELAFCVPLRGVGEHPRRSIYDPEAVRGVKRLRPGQEVELDWSNRGDGWLWMEAPEAEVELPEGVEEVLQGLEGRDWRKSIGQLASRADLHEAALVLSDVVDSNRGANVALDALLEVLQRLPAGELPEEVATSLVFGLFHPYDNGIRVKCARGLGNLRLSEAESALRDCVAVRPTSRDGVAFEKQKHELHQAVAEALKRIMSAPRAPAVPSAAPKSIAGFLPVRKDDKIWFWISDHEVTNAEYKSFVDATGHSPPDKGSFGAAVWKGDSYPAGLAEYPVVCVSWNDAAAYCRWLTQIEQRARRIRPEEVYRLPTVAEWKYAAYGPRRLKYPWGNDWDEKKLNGWSSGDRPSPQKPVAGLVSTRSMPDGRSWCGCYHMWGNVWEWTTDRSTRDGRPSRVLLGGAWYDKIGPNSPARHNRTVDDRRNDMGFRPVRVREEERGSAAASYKLLDTFETNKWRSTKENCRVALELSSRVRKSGSRSLSFYKAEKVIHDGKISRPVRLPRGAKGLRFWVMKGGKEAPTLGIALSGDGTHFLSGSADKDLNDALQDLPKGVWRQVEVYFDPERMSSWPRGREFDLTRIDTLVIRVGDNKSKKDFGRVLFIDDMELMLARASR